MMLSPVTITRLEKVATDSGFDLDLGRLTGWLHYGSSQTSTQIWLTAVGEAPFLVAMSRADVLDAVAAISVPLGDHLPAGAAGGGSVPDIPALHHLLRRVFQLSRTLPDELLHIFEGETANLPRS